MSSSVQKALIRKAEVVADSGFTKNLLFWYSKNKESHPWREYWKQYKSPYHVWVSEIMLQQTLIKVVTPLYVRFIKKFPNLQSLAAAETKDLQQAVKGLGYYNRFDRLHKAAKFLCGQGESLVWPNTFESWKKIPGVGDYTASALSSICFNEAAAVVDGNVERVFSRIFCITEEINSYAMKKNLRQVGQTLLCVKNPGDFNQALMELGQKVCLKAKPLCHLCPVAKNCKALAKNKTEELPVVIKNKKSVAVQLKALVIEKKGKIFLEQRDKSSKFLKNRLGFPLVESKQKPKQVLGSFSHQITHHKISVDVVKSLKTPENGLWVSKETLASHLIASLDNKVLKALERANS